MQCLEGPQRTPQTLLPTFNKGRLSGSCWAHKTPAGIFGAGSFNGRLYQTYLPVTYICNRIFKESDCSNFLVKGGMVRLKGGGQAVFDFSHIKTV